MPLSAPTKIETPFATSGSKNTIPVPSQIGVTPGAASYTDGFPPLTMTPLASGGVPPFGQDFNGVLYEITNSLQWQQAMSGAYAYDSAFATAVGGYPLGAAVLRSDGLGLWINQTANNSTDPEAGGAGWMPLIQPGATSVTMTGSNVTLTSLQAGKDIIIISGALTGNLNLIFPTYVKTWTVLNNTTGSYSITAKTASGTGVIVTQGAASAILGDGVNIVSATGGRARLTANSALYVATTGSDSTGTGTSGNPFATLQYAYDYAHKNYDLNGYTLTINVAAGTYTTALAAQGAVIGQNQQNDIVINGAGATTIISTTSTSAITAYGTTQITISNIKLQTATSGDCVNSNAGASISIGSGVVFGACADNHMSATGGGNIFVTDSYTISGNGDTHFNAQGGQILNQVTGAIVATISTTVAITDFANAAELGLLRMSNWSSTGSAVTGKRYSATLNGVINTNGGGASYFPGSISGSTSTGGQYA